MHVLAPQSSRTVVCWLRRAAGLWNCLLAAPTDSLLGRALASNLRLVAATPAGVDLAWQPWAAQLAQALALVGQPIDLQRPAAIPRRQLQQRCAQHHLGGVAAAAGRENATKIQHYLQRV